MSPPTPVPVEQVVAQNELAVPRFERVSVIAGVSTFLVVVSVGFVLWLVEFQVDRRIVRAALWGLAIGFVVWFKMTTPTSKLTPAERSLRAKRRVSALLGFLGSLSVLGSIVVAYSLHTWQDVVRLVLVASSPIGFGLMIRTSFGMGSK